MSTGAELRNKLRGFSGDKFAEEVKIPDDIIYQTVRGCFCPDIKNSDQKSVAIKYIVFKYSGKVFGAEAADFCDGYIVNLGTIEEVEEAEIVQKVWVPIPYVGETDNDTTIVS